jgi:hypothetical protein
VRLAPCGSASVRFLNAQGKPAAGHRAQVHLLLTTRPPAKDSEAAFKARRLYLDALIVNAWDRGAAPTAEEVTLQDLLSIYRGAGLDADAEGRLNLPGLIPGATYRIDGVESGPREFRVEAGQAVALGDLRLPAPPAPKAPPTK